MPKLTISFSLTCELRYRFEGSEINRSYLEQLRIGVILCIRKHPTYTFEQRISGVAVC